MRQESHNSVLGVGYKKNDGSLKLLNRNGVNFVFFSKTLLACDVWEHSYYIDYMNKKSKYIENFLDNLVNWEYVASKL